MYGVRGTTGEGRRRRGKVLVLVLWKLREARRGVGDVGALCEFLAEDIRRGMYGSRYNRNSPAQSSAFQSVAIRTTVDSTSRALPVERKSAMDDLVAGSDDAYSLP